MNNILITTSSFDSTLLNAIQSAGFNAILNPFKRKLSEEEVAGLLQEHRPIGMIAGVEPLTRNVLEKAPYLKTISRCGIGMDSVDLTAAAELNITVTNTPDAPTIPVAELTLGMMLALLRSIHKCDSSIRSGDWDRPMGSLLHGKKVGIIGCGRIGTYVARLLEPFGCDIVGFDPYLNVHASIMLVSLDTLLETSDIVTLHIPYSVENHHLLDNSKISAMKQGAVLINAARGGLVDEMALAEALDSARLSGAAIDCFETEPYTGPLAQMENTLLTGHIGSYAREGRLLMEQQAVDNLISILNTNKQVL